MMSEEIKTRVNVGFPMTAFHIIYLGKHTVGDICHMLVACLLAKAQEKKKPYTPKNCSCLEQKTSSADQKS